MLTANNCNIISSQYYSDLLDNVEGVKHRKTAITPTKFRGCPIGVWLKFLNAYLVILIDMRFIIAF